MKYCYDCRQCIDSYAKFCPNCGKALGENIPEPETPKPINCAPEYTQLSLILGVLALLSVCGVITAVFYPFLAVPAVVFAILSKPKAGRMNRFARTGLVFAIMPLVVILVLLVLFLMVRYALGEGDRLFAALPARIRYFR